MSGPWECEECDKQSGTKNCRRKTLVDSAYGGKKCGPKEKEEKCPVDCELTPFDEFTPCTKTCGGMSVTLTVFLIDLPCAMIYQKKQKTGGTQSRSRSIKIGAKNGGAPCVGEKVESKKCAMNGCPVDCKVGPWECSACNKMTGYQKCSRKRLVEPKFVCFLFLRLFLRLELFLIFREERNVHHATNIKNAVCIFLEIVFEVLMFCVCLLNRGGLRCYRSMLTLVFEIVYKLLWFFPVFLNSGVDGLHAAEPVEM